ncbi:EscU/YscU/HrcU family type III secretion system export apparatus switch protein [Shewanella sp. 1_MG-2023]|uniref:EscU/YscU/HrcU family type III secretion system export apparatus switch protein n=1 Tax=unclassified Shewanella TaxID=196818 RepID=UPI000C85C5AC|nr:MULTISPECIES: EscU/YscU/HrcU family type III secretion system export apparatus switch protein [unclassified Shewanella]MCC4832625.1 EscU/YscU/HrcU family type III secretion system export apparatus switch protein [Shewanella sp. 10N.7]MDO6612511.1 EscU/YscU/HrcU family type III secretion system export apparatus switch protein [Shewanella sp. 7_MG-2023]MDO6772448.1 EscU/YscU/HrcU family type III secretion system export apparatus switch protein [Shewanella sp. 2_MG-2023]MDO6794554.1 EscU/YscU/H
MTDVKKAVALSFDGNSAPTITATGKDLVAEEIISLAKEAGVYIHQDEHLSHFLQLLELGDEVPEELYTLIAELIAFVYMLDGKFPEQWNNLHHKIIDKA